MTPNVKNLIEQAVRGGNPDSLLNTAINESAFKVGDRVVTTKPDADRLSRPGDQGVVVRVWGPDQISVVLDKYQKSPSTADMDIVFQAHALKPAGAKAQSAERWLIALVFYECEHSGDLNHYLRDIEHAGGKVTYTKLNNREETGEVTVEVSGDLKEFFNKLKHTNSDGMFDVESQRKA